ncbi:MAG: rhodanese-like domain-containing protein [Chthonomonas sp.]|nr:rhodanese-like domain-containing protein [Chthonomonas sp.]
MTVLELKSLMDQGTTPFLLDVREPFELEICQIPGALSIPINDLPTRMGEIPQTVAVVVFCRSGGRSQNAVDYLSDHGYTLAVNLDGGILAWSRDIDPSMPTY